MEYVNYEICRKSKVYEYIQNGIEFSIVDMEKKKVYTAQDLRLSELAEKLNKDTTFVVKEVNS